MSKTLKIDNQIIEKLGLVTLNRILCDTDKGLLKLQLRKGESTYHFVLDSVPVSKALNKELMDLIFPIPKMEAPKQVNKEPQLEIIKPEVQQFYEKPKQEFPIKMEELSIKHKVDGKTVITASSSVGTLPKPKGRPAKVK